MKNYLRCHARDIGFTSTNIDLIYGLPKQTPESFATLKRDGIRNLDRLSVFNHAHLPTLLPPSVKFKDADLLQRSETGYFAGDDRIAYQAGYQFISGWTILPVRDEPVVAQRESAPYFIGLYDPWRCTDSADVCYQQHDWRWLHAEPERAEALFRLSKKWMSGAMR